MIEHYLDNTPCECDSMERMYSDSGKLMQECPMVNGMANGKCRTYYDSGVILEEFMMLNDELHGIMKTYYRNETLRLENSIKDEPYHLKLAYWETPYEEGLKHGIEKGYFESGTLGYEGEWNTGRIICEKTYHENGKLAVETPFRDGDFHGLVKMLYPSGNPYQEIPFADGHIHGLRTIYHSVERFSQDFYSDDHFYDIPEAYAGTIQRIPYVNGEKHGLETFHFADGKPFSEVTWKKGQQTGIQRGFDEASGKQFWEAEFAEGKQHGIEKTYYDTGALKTECMFENGKRNGEKKTFDESGRLRRRSLYKEGKRIGEEELFDEEGKKLYFTTQAVQNNDRSK